MEHKEIVIYNPESNELRTIILLGRHKTKAIAFINRLGYVYVGNL